MSCFEVEVLEPNIHTIEIETCIDGQVASLDIIQYNIASLEVTHCIALLPSDYETIVSGLIPVYDIISGTGIYISSNSGIFTINTSGLQPSGNYSLVGHSHNSSDIINFNNSVSGLLPVKNISSGSGIQVSNNDGDFIIAVTGSFGLTSEEVDDRVSNLLVAGNYINLDYNDLNNTLTISTTGLQPSGNYSIVGHSHNISDINNLQDTLDNKQPLGFYASGIHFHYTSDIINFSSGVSGLLPSVIGNGYIISSLIDNNYIISASGLQPSGNYSVVGHSHSTTDITNFNSGVSGLLPSVTGSSYISASFNNNIYTISASGLQPSGNYSVVGHTHTSSEITDFNSAVSGLIPPSNFTSLSGVSGIVVTNSGTNYYVGLSDPTIQLADITDLSSNARTFLLTPSSTNLSTLVSDETGSGSLVFNNSPIFSGIPIVPTASSGTNTQQIASTQFVRTEISNLVNSAPSTLDTLNELATALGNDPNFATTVTNSLANKANLSGAVFTGSVTIPSGTGNFNSLTVNSTGVSLNGHTHSYTDITNFASGVDSVLSTALVAGTGIYLYEDNIANTLTISTTGVSLVGHSHTSSSITDFNSSVSGLLPVKNILGNGYINVGSSSGVYTISATGLQPSGNYSIVGHTHTSSNITDFDSSVSGLLPSISGSGYVNSSFINNTYTISVTGLQPSGNYSVVGHSHIISEVSGLQNALDSKQPSGVYASGIHTHLYSDITDFNSGVSGLLPVKNILSGTGISISSTSGVYTINSIGSGVLADQASALVTTVFNKTGSPIPKMSAVYINGGQGDLPTVSLAIATSDMTSAGTYGLTYETISNMQSGKVIVFGALTGLDTDQFNPTTPHGNINGTVLYLSPYVSGALTVSKPIAPNHIVAIGTVVRTHQNEGIIEVRVQNGFELEELHNVAISGVTNGQFLQYNSGSGLWVPSSNGNFTSLSVNSTGVSLDGHSHISSNITDFNSSVSGLLPTIANSGDNRVLTSIGTSVGINAENNLTFDGSTLNIDGNLTFDSFTESVISIGNSSSGVIISIGNGTVQTCTLTANCVFTMPTATAGKSFTMFLNTGSGNYTASFSGVLWPDNTSPTITVSANKVDILSFISNGSSWYGSYSQNYGS